MGFFQGFFDRFRRNPRPTEVIGVPGFPYYGGFIGDAEKDPSLQGIEKYKTFSNIISNTAVVASSIRFYLNFLSHPGWRMDSADEKNREADEIAEFVDDEIHGMRRPWHRVVKRGGTQPFYGYDIQEIAFEPRPDGRIGLLSVDPRPQHTIELWDIDEHGEVHGVVQRSPWDNREVYLPRWKYLYIGDDSLTDNPEGIGLLRQVAPSAKRLSRFEQLEMFGYETNLHGIPIGYAPLRKMLTDIKNDQLTEAQMVELLAPIKQFMERHIRTPTTAMLLDSMTYTANDDAQTPSGTRQWAIEQLQSGVAGLAEIHTAVTRINHDIARILGMEHLLLGQERGTQALSKNKTDNVRLQIESTLTELSWSFQRDLIEPLCRANGWPEELWPSIEHDPLHHGNVEDLIKGLQGLALAGAPMDRDDPAINVVRAAMRLPDQPDFGLSRALDAGLRGDLEIDSPLLPTPAALAPPEPVVDPTEDSAAFKQKADAVGVLVRAGFTPAAALQAAGLPSLEHVGLLPITVKEPAPAVPPPDPAAGEIDVDLGSNG